MRNPVLILAALLAAAPLSASSYYTARLNDAKAVYLTRDQFGVRSDGVDGDTAGIQKAINRPAKILYPASSTMGASCGGDPRRVGPGMAGYTTRPCARPETRIGCE